MSITMKLDLPDDIAERARAAGLLDPRRVAGLIARELSAGEDSRDFFELIRAIRAQPGEPLTDEEIAAEVKAARRERRAREAGT